MTSVDEISEAELKSQVAVIREALVLINALRETHHVQTVAELVIALAERETTLSLGLHRMGYAPAPGIPSTSAPEKGIDDGKHAC